MLSCLNTPAKLAGVTREVTQGMISQKDRVLLNCELIVVFCIKMYKYTSYLCFCVLMCKCVVVQLFEMGLLALCVSVM